MYLCTLENEEQVKSHTLILSFLMLCSCGNGSSTGNDMTDGENADPIWGSSYEDNDVFDLPSIQASGEIIMLTTSGPDTYYDYHGKELGAQYLLCLRLAKHLGVGLRVEVCKDTISLIQRLDEGYGDIAGVDSLGHWMVAPNKHLLLEAINTWYSPTLLQEVKEYEKNLLTGETVKRKVYAPMLNKKRGMISKYDNLFRNYSLSIHWDWRLMAAQCYQESTFDPDAQSWAGAMGLMQIMPSTAEHLGLALTDILDPESNISAAAKFIGELEQKFSDIPSRDERINFILAAYNCGPLHLRDAMALTGKHGDNPKKWNDVAKYVLKLSESQYYNDPVVKHGYMRGSETVDYVTKIRQRWQTYRSVASPRKGTTSPLTPQKATKNKNKYE